MTRRLAPGHVLALDRAALVSALSLPSAARSLPPIDALAAPRSPMRRASAQVAALESSTAVGRVGRPRGWVCRRSFGARRSGR